MTAALVARLFDLDLWVAGFSHFILLAAGLQIPYRLRWKQDLAPLMPFNRKLLWVQGGFTVITIIAFGVMTLALHAELLRGDRAALALAVFIAVFWTARLLVDAFYFSHRDWPPGKQFVAGHILLNTVFVFLAGSYWSLVVWHGWAGAHG